MARLSLFACGLLVLNYVSVCSSGTPCTEMSACTANCGGKKIDISSLYKSVNTIPNDKYDYMFACSHQTCNGHENVAVCQKETNGDLRQWSLGAAAANTSKWELITKTPLQFTISYIGGDPEGKNQRNSLVTFTANDSSVPKGVHIKEDKDSATYEFSFTASSKYYAASSKGGSGDVSGYIGIVIIILAIMGFVTYFIVGMSYMYFVKGARGLEVIPNVSFWKDLPYLLKDGFLFTISPCYKRGDYEKI